MPSCDVALHTHDLIDLCCDDNRRTANVTSRHAPITTRPGADAGRWK
jgi:hypothetical protein